jgi:hypothetical protein
VSSASAHAALGEGVTDVSGIGDGSSESVELRNDAEVSV